MAFAVHAARVNRENDRSAVARSDIRRGFDIGRKMHMVPPHFLQTLARDQRRGLMVGPVVEAIRRDRGRKSQIDGNTVALVRPDLRPGLIEGKALLVVVRDNDLKLFARRRHPILRTGTQKVVHNDPTAGLQFQTGFLRLMPQNLRKLSVDFLKPSVRYLQ